MARLNALVFKLGVGRFSAELKPKPGGLVEPNPRVGVGRLNAIFFTSAWADSTSFSFFFFFVLLLFPFLFLLFFFGTLLLFLLFLFVMFDFNPLFLERVKSFFEFRNQP